ncbi:regulatory protein RecX [Aurantibacter aestuarii]|uniref:Regulatory protein RecX n=1 Tax=Aurantibacter aestuarii TaxID=1266046 RepID=A0A2T1NDM8_9FLAO|nr:regulatory protein RecX [Aurantibacter aestuarii]PSG90548.1 recombinase RecX [Aurantibacter aestuarii]
MIIKTSYTIEEAKRKLEHYCAYQERCHKEVVSKLRELQMIPQAIDVILVHLLDHNFLNETRFAETFARGKFRVKKWGKRRIENELKLRQISAYNIKKGLAQISENDYFETFDLLALKRLEAITETNKYKKRKKLADYLLYRGWDSSMVYNKVKELIP